MVDEEPYTDARYKWYPNPCVYYDEFVVNPGDVIVVSISVTVRAAYADEVQYGLENATF
jgi:hypothetical protein